MDVLNKTKRLLVRYTPSQRNYHLYLRPYLRMSLPRTGQIISSAGLRSSAVLSAKNRQKAKLNSRDNAKNSRESNGVHQTQNIFKSYKSYDHLVQTELDRGDRTLLIQSPAADIFESLSTSNLRKIFNDRNNEILQSTRYKILGAYGAKNCVTLVEFQSRTGLDSLIKGLNQSQTSFIFPSGYFPLASRTVKLRQLPSRIIPDNSCDPVINVTASSDQSTPIRTHDTVRDVLAANNMSHPALKLKFFTISQLSQLLCSGFFDNFELIPFGSTVSGLGNDLSDLDILMTPKENILSTRDPNPRMDSTVFQFDCNSVTDQSPKRTASRALGLIADLMAMYTPYVKRIIRILNARVPILRFTFDTTGTECDLSLDLSRGKSFSGVEMARLQFALTLLDHRFRPLMILLKLWSHNHSLNTHSTGVTSFHLLTLLIFYFQQCSPPVLPPLVDLLKNDSHSFKSVNNRPIEQHIIEFMRYYSSFDFHSLGISPYSGKIIEHKPSHSPIFIENPLDRSLNAAQSIIGSSLASFVDVCQASFFTLEDSASRDLVLQGVHSVVTGGDHSDSSSKIQPHRTETLGVDALDLKELLSETIASDTDDRLGS